MRVRHRARTDHPPVGTARLHGSSERHRRGLTRQRDLDECETYVPRSRRKRHRGLGVIAAQDGHDPRSREPIIEQLVGTLCRHPGHFTAPAVMPLTIRFCKKMKINVRGTSA